MYRNDLLFSYSFMLRKIKGLTLGIANYCDSNLKLQVFICNDKVACYSEL